MGCRAYKSYESSYATGTIDHTFQDPLSEDATRYFLNNAKRMDSPDHGAISHFSSVIDQVDDQNRDLVLGGFGGDVLLGGSPAYLFDLLRSGELAQFFRDLWTMRLRPNQSRTRFILSKTAAPLWHRLDSRIRKPHRGEFPNWIHKSRIACLESDSSARARLEVPRQRYRHQNQILDTIKMQQALGAQEGAEQLRASEGLALGSPLIDVDILDFAFRVPPRAFSDGRRYKQILKKRGVRQLWGFHSELGES